MIRTHLFIVFPLVFLGVLELRLDAIAKDDKPIENVIQREQTRLEQLKKEIQHTKKKKKETQEKHDDILQTIETVDRDLAKENREYEEINHKLKKIDRELDEVAQHLESLRSQLKIGRQSIMARLRLLYMEGRGNKFKALLATRSYSEFQRRFDYLSTIAKREHALIEKYRTDIETETSLKVQQSEARDSLLRHKQLTGKKLQKIKTIRKRKKVILESLKKEQTLHAEALRALQQRENRKEALLKELEQRRKLERLEKKQRKAFRPDAGSLLWPVQGKVITRFGRQKHPNYDTYIHKKGIEIRTSEVTTIRAVSAGKVVYADWLKGYGQVVILDHHNGFFSLYAHASKLNVKVDNTVSTGQALGQTGDSGLIEDNILYFELRKGIKPVDPLRWLVKRP